jgi:hypothetical protein
MMKEESDRLIDAWLDGTLDSQEAGELNAWVKESPGHAAQFADRTHLHSSLLEWGAAERLRPARAEDEAHGKRESKILELPRREHRGGGAQATDAGTRFPRSVRVGNSRGLVFSHSLSRYAAAVTALLACTVLGAGSLFFVTSESFLSGSAGDRDVGRILKLQAREIAELRRRLDGVREQMEVNEERKELSLQLDAARDRSALAIATLSSLEEEAARARTELYRVRDEWDKYRETYRVAERASAKGEKYAELTLADGKKLSDVTVLDVDAARMQVRHSGGIVGIDWQDLPGDFQDRFQFDVKEKEVLLAMEQDDARFLGLQKKIVEMARSIRAKRAQAEQSRAAGAKASEKASALAVNSQQMAAQIQSKRSQISAEQEQKPRRTEVLTNELHELERQQNALAGQISTLRAQASSLQQEAGEQDAQAAELEQELRDLQQQLKQRQAEADGE